MVTLTVVVTRKPLAAELIRQNFVVISKYVDVAMLKGGLDNQVNVLFVHSLILILASR